MELIDSITCPVLLNLKEEYAIEALIISRVLEKMNSLENSLFRTGFLLLEFQMRC